MCIDDVTISQSSQDSLTIKMSVLERRIYFLALCVSVFGALAESHLVPEDGTSCSSLLRAKDNQLQQKDNLLREQTRIMMGLDDTIKLNDDENTKNDVYCEKTDNLKNARLSSKFSEIEENLEMCFSI